MTSSDRTLIILGVAVMVFVCALMLLMAKISGLKTQVNNLSAGMVCPKQLCKREQQRRNQEV